MPNRSEDWLKQSLRDIEQARDPCASGRHGWACFTAQQAAEKAVKALHIFLGQEARGRVVRKLLEELPVAIPDELLDKARVLDSFNIPTRRSRMPARSLSSAVLVRPDLASVLQAARAWAAKTAESNSELRRIICFGSAARGAWGVGSDLDVLVEVASSDVPFARRPLSFESPQVPVPVEILVHTTEEIGFMRREGRRFIRDVDADSTVLYDAGGIT